MRTKNIFLAIATFSFAIGSAFASMFAATTVYVWGKEISGSVPTCIATNKMCTQTADETKICWVQFNVGIGGTQTACSTCTFKTYTSGCSTILFDERDVDQTGGMTDLGDTIYDLIAH